jgi:hypothetical protein
MFNKTRILEEIDFIYGEGQMGFDDQKDLCDLMDNYLEGDNFLNVVQKADTPEKISLCHKLACLFSCTWETPISDTDAERHVNALVAEEILNFGEAERIMGIYQKGYNNPEGSMLECTQEKIHVEYGKAIKDEYISEKAYVLFLAKSAVEYAINADLKEQGYGYESTSENEMLLTVTSSNAAAKMVPISQESGINNSDVKEKMDGGKEIERVLEGKVPIVTPPNMPAVGFLPLLRQAGPSNSDAGGILIEAETRDEIKYFLKKETLNFEEEKDLLAKLQSVPAIAKRLNFFKRTHSEIEGAIDTIERGEPKRRQISFVDRVEEERERNEVNQGISFP